MIENLHLKFCLKKVARKYLIEMRKEGGVVVSLRVPLFIYKRIQSNDEGARSQVSRTIITRRVLATRDEGVRSSGHSVGERVLIL